MLMMLLTVFIVFLINLTFIDLIFKTNFNEFVNSLMFKTVLMNNI